MRLIRASIRNLMGIELADLDLGHVNVFVGPNGSGKSTILEALLLPVFGETPRAAKKKDWGAMIRDGARNAEVYVQVGTKQPDGTEIVRELNARISPKSATVEPMRQASLHDRVLLDPLAFFSLPPAVKADLVGTVQIDSAALAAELTKRGIHGRVGTLVHQVIMTYGLSGAEKELTERRLLASRAIVEPGPEPKLIWNGQETTIPQKDEIQAAMAYSGELAMEVQRTRQAVMEARARNQARANVQSGITDAIGILARAAVPETFPREKEFELAKAKIAAMREEREALETKYDKLIHDVKPCPTCGKPWKAPEEANEIESKISAIDGALRSEIGVFNAMSAELGDWKAQVNQQSWAVAKKEKGEKDLAALGPFEPESATSEAYENACKKQAEYSEWVRTISTAASAHEAWEARREAGATAKAEREAWDLAVQTIRDPTFKSGLTHDPLQRVRDRIQSTQEILDMKIELGDDLEVQVNGRPWWLLSTSQRMRASMVLADAFAHAGGSRILKIDGVDINVGRMQHKIVTFIRMVKDAYDTVLLALASDDAPPAFKLLEQSQKMDPGYQTLARWFWVGNSTAMMRREL